MHIVDGPTWSAKLSTATPTYTKDDVIIGIRFNDILEVGETITYFTIGIRPIIEDTESREGDDEHHESITNDNDNNEEEKSSQFFFPPDTFEVVVRRSRCNRCKHW